jgi:HK97 family phage major capsid protein
MFTNKSGNINEARQARASLTTQIEAIVMTAGDENRGLTDFDQKQLVSLRSEASMLDSTIRTMENDPNRSLARIVRDNPHALLGAGGAAPGAGFAGLDPTSPLAEAGARNPEYAQALHSFILSGGKAHGAELLAGADGNGGYVLPGSGAYTRQRGANGSFLKTVAATYEGSLGSSNGAGGYAISVPTSDLIVPLALPDLGIFDAAQVIPTSNDLKVPQQASFGTSALKTESTGTVATFGGTDPALSQITLASFMAGALRVASWELLQDVPTFQSFIVDDLIKGQRILEGSLLATGTGVNQPQGVFGNVGTGTGSPYALTGAVTDGMVILESLFDVVSTLKAMYQPNASWIMSRTTALAIRKAQLQTNAFYQICTEDADGTLRILGRPVYFDQNAPSLPSSTNAGVQSILFGDFKTGYIIGVRGGAGINVKILDQPYAASGQLGLLAYRRLDGRVRRSEAIQGVTFSHS